MLVYVDSHFVVVVALYNERASRIISSSVVQIRGKKFIATTVQTILWIGPAYKLIRVDYFSYENMGPDVDSIETGFLGS